MTTIYLIDDDASRHQQLDILIRTLNVENNNQYLGTECPGDTEKAHAHALDSINPVNVWRKVSTAPIDSIFLIDLKLEPINEEKSYEDLLAFLAADSSDWKEAATSDVKTAFQKYPSLAAYRTAIFACAVLNARRVKTLIISSAALDGARILRNRWPLVIATSTRDSASEWMTWKEKISELMRHPDRVVSDILMQYAGLVIADPDGNAWRHNDCERAASINLAKSIWHYDDIDEQINKAFHTRSDGWTVLEELSRPISEEALKAAVERLELGCKLEYDVEETTLLGHQMKRFCFPVEPGIAFLLSLKELFYASKKRIDNRDALRNPEKLVFGKRDELHWVAVHFDPKSWGGRSAFIERLIRKPWKTHSVFDRNMMAAVSKDSTPDSKKERAVSEIREHVPDGGLSEAVFHLAHCRLGEIRVTEDEGWAQMFRNGARKWVAWPSLGESCIIFYWI